VETYPAVHRGDLLDHHTTGKLAVAAAVAAAAEEALAFAAERQVETECWVLGCPTHQVAAVAVEIEALLLRPHLVLLRDNSCSWEKIAAGEDH
jgi:hypothetical protein